MIYDALFERYQNKSLTLLDIYNNEELMKKFPTKYIPNIEFIIQRDSIASFNDVIYKIRYIYCDPRGKVRTAYDTYMSQVSNACKGYLIRLSCPITSVTYLGMNLDYIVDISNIKITSQDLYSISENKLSINTDILEDINYYFISENVELINHLDNRFKRFDSCREEIFNEYFT